MIPAELLAEYKSTSYIVYDKDITIEINKHNKRLDELLRENAAVSWAFITAWNPYSKILPYEDNNIRHQQLISKTKEYVCFEGEGRGRDPQWKPENSLLILGISKDDAVEIGNHFKQYAIVTGEYGNAAELQISKLKI